MLCLLLRLRESTLVDESCECRSAADGPEEVLFLKKNENEMEERKRRMLLLLMSRIWKVDRTWLKMDESHWTALASLLALVPPWPPRPPFCRSIPRSSHPHGMNVRLISGAR